MKLPKDVIYFKRSIISNVNLKKLRLRLAQKADFWLSSEASNIWGVVGRDSLLMLPFKYVIQRVRDGKDVSVDRYFDQSHQN